MLAETDTSGNTNEYIFFGGQRIADVPAGSTPVYYVSDMLNTSRVITSNTGVVCYDADFTPYGGEGTWTDNCPERYRFEGKERDAETINDYFGARYYTERFGRWLSSDWSAVPTAVPYANLTNPQTLNLYSMVADDPESFADLDGHSCEHGNGVNGGSGPCMVEDEMGEAEAAYAQGAQEASEQAKAPQRTCNGNTCTFTKRYNETEFQGGDVITRTATVTNTTTHNSDGTTTSRTDVQGTITRTHADGNGNFTSTQTTWGIGDLYGSRTPTQGTTKQLSYGEAVKVHGAAAMSLAQDKARPGAAAFFTNNIRMGIVNPSARNVEHVAAGALMGLCFVGEPCGAVEAILSLVVGGVAYAESRDKH